MLSLKTESQNEVRKLRNGRHHKLLTDTIVLAKLVPIHVKKVLVLSCSTTIPFVLNNSPGFIHKSETRTIEFYSKENWCGEGRTLTNRILPKWIKRVNQKVLCTNAPYHKP